MTEYDFRSLSPRDFERLCRDLLQAEWGITLESFSAGPDSGIDFRGRSHSGDVVVQCKHYVESGVARLVSHLKKKERKKVVTLNPARYVITTSVRLTPARKQEIFNLFSPYCSGPDDILGSDDLNNLLGLHERVEKAHYKLWLTSSSVLERMLNAGVVTDSEALLEDVRQRLALYVPNASLGRAHQLLSEHHCCIIAGIPGIGKTTLAEVLLAELADRQGFQVCRVANDLEEIRPLKRRDVKQVFYFDDFLGRTALNSLRRNEDRRLVELIAEVKDVPGWRLIMTTREYILNAARQRYEAFSHPRTDLATCVVSLADYNREVRAEILYNHIYFSDLEIEYKIALLDDGGYRRVLSHNNYNPRIVQYMTQSIFLDGVPADRYKETFLDRLERPTMIWEHPFRYQISEAARSLVLVLATLPADSLVEDLEAAFWSFHGLRRQEYGFDGGPEDWRNALREVEGTFVLTHELAGTVVARFHSPSVEDFVEGVLRGDTRSVRELVQAVRFFEQYETLWRIVADRQGLAAEGDRLEFAEALAGNLGAESASLARVIDRAGEEVRFVRGRRSHEGRVELLSRVSRVVRSGGVSAALDAEIELLKGAWARGEGEKWDLLRLIGALREERRWREDEELLWSSWECFLAGCRDIEDYFRTAEFFSEYPEVVSAGELHALRSGFGALVREYAEDPPWDDDPEYLRATADEIELASSKLGMRVPRRHVEALNRKAEEREEETAFYEDEEPFWDEEESARRESSAEETDWMFENLLRELRG